MKLICQKSLSAIYHIIKLPFDAKVTEKFLNGIYQVTSVIERELDWFINNEKAVGKEPTSNYRRFGEGIMREEIYWNKGNL